MALGVDVGKSKFLQLCMDLDVEPCVKSLLSKSAHSSRFFSGMNTMIKRLVHSLRDGTLTLESMHRWSLQPKCDCTCTLCHHPLLSISDKNEASSSAKDKRIFRFRYNDSSDCHWKNACATCRYKLVVCAELCHFLRMVQMGVMQEQSSTKLHRQCVDLRYAIFQARVML